jgi:hypothetical protein
MARFIAVRIWAAEFSKSVVGREMFLIGLPAGSGLTTGPAVLKAGFVLVGNMPTSDGTSASVKPGSLMAINQPGRLDLCEQTGNRRSLGLHRL